MALYHFSVTQVKRSKGHTAIAAAAYRSGPHFRGICAQEYGGKAGTLVVSRPHTDLLTGETYTGNIALDPWQTLILREN